MIYLVQSYYTDKQGFPRKCLKIGYAKNIEDRMKAYKTYNPSIQLLKTREGEYDLESFLHRYFDKYKLSDFNEWFVYKKEIIDKFDVLEIQEDTITREEYLEYIRKEILTSIIPEIYKDLKSQIPDLLDELKQEFKDNYNDIYSSLYTEFPENECKEIIIRSFKFLRELEIDYFTDYSFSDIISKFPEEILRQRLKENVFRDECIFIYKLSDKDITMEEFERRSKDKMLKTEQDLRNYKAVLEKEGISGTLNLLEDFRDRVQKHKYGKDYTRINERTGEPIINKIVFISERRSYELRSNVYKNEVQVYNEFAKITPGLSYDNYLKKLELLDRLKQDFRLSGSFEKKMEFICLTLLDPTWFNHIFISDLYWLPLNFRNYLNTLGPERIKSLGYREIEIKREINSLKCSDLVRDSIINLFLIGEKYSLKSIKEILGDLYSKLGISKSPKATDILEYFEVKEYMSTDKITKKRVNGYLILSLKE